MTIDALRRLVELLVDTAGYAHGLHRADIAGDLARAADAAGVLLDEERVAAGDIAPGRPSARGTIRPEPPACA